MASLTGYMVFGGKVCFLFSIAIMEINSVLGVYLTKVGWSEVNMGVGGGLRTDVKESDIKWI